MCRLQLLGFILLAFCNLFLNRSDPLIEQESLGLVNHCASLAHLRQALLDLLLLVLLIYQSGVTCHLNALYSLRKR